MRIALTIIAAMLAAGAAQAQRHKPTINAETPEGKMLQHIGDETDEAKKAALLEQFAAQHPTHEAMPWVYEAMVTAYTKTGNFDKALDAGAKLLALDPEDVETAHLTLKAAEAKKDPDAVLKWSNTTSAIARKIAATPKPADESDTEDWKRAVDYAKQVDVYTEYSIYAMVLQTPDAQKRLMLAQALETRNPESQYYPQVAEATFLALVQAGKGPEAVALADRAIAKNAASPEMLIAVAAQAIAKEPDKAIELATKAAQATAAKPKPEGVTDADWQAHQAQLTGRAEWVIGRAYASQSKWAQADKSLRAALPAVRNDKAMLAEALFYLGLANYRIGEAGETARIKDALEFNQQCAAIPGPFAAAAAKNIKAIRAQYRVK